MTNCKYKITLGGQAFEFSSDEELNSFLNNNYNRLKSFEKGNESINFSKDFNPKEEILAKLQKANIESDEATISFDSDGNKVESHVGSGYTGVTSSIKKITRGGKSIVKRFDEANYRANRKAIDLPSLSKLPEYRNLSKEEIEKIIDDNISADISKWKMLANMGSDIHAIAEQYFKHGVKDPATMISKIEKPFTIGTMTKYLDMLADIHNEIRGFTQDPDVTILTEVKIHDSSSRVAGIIDLVAIDKKGNVHIYDYKTSHKRFGDWDSTKLRAMEYQMAFYTQLLATKGITVSNVNIIPLELLDVDYSNNIVSDVRKIETLDLNHRLFNNANSAYIMRDARSAIPTELTSLMEKNVESENIKKELKNAFDYNIAMRRVAASVDEFIKGEVKTESDGTGRKFFLRGKERVYLTGKEEADKKAIEGHLAELAETGKNVIADHRNHINAVINGVTGKSISSRFGKHNDEKRNKTFQIMFSRYIDGMWEVVESADLDALGILAFRNKITNTVEFVSVTTNALKSKVKLSKGTTILGNYIDDRAALNNKDIKLLDSSNASIEMIKVAMWLNDNYKALSGGSSQDLNIGMIRAVNFTSGETVGVNTDDLIYSYDRLCKYTKAENNIRKVKFLNHYDLLLAKIDTIINNGADVSQQMKSRLENLKETIDLDETSAKIEALKIVQKNWIREMGIDTNNMQFSHESVASNIYALINASILNLAGLPVRWEENTKRLALNNSNMMSTINNMSSPTIQIENNLVKTAMQNIRVSHVNFKEATRDKYEELFESAGLSKFRRYAIGDNIKAYDNLFVKDKNGKVSGELILKDPYNPSTPLSAKEREFLKFYLEQINAHRYKNADIEEVDFRKQSGDWFKLPLIRAASVSRLKNREYANAMKDWYNDMLNFGNMFSEEHEENAIQSQEMLEMYNQFSSDGTEGGAEKRQKYLADRDTSEFEQDLELVLDAYTMAHSRKEEYDKVLPFIHALRATTQWNHAGYLNKDVGNLLEFMKNYVKVSVYNEKLIEPHLEKYAKVGMIFKSWTTKLNLGVSPITFFKEILQGQFGNYSAKFSGLYGDDSFLAEDYNKALKIMLSDAPDFIDTVTKVEELNHLYGIAGMDINAIDRKMASSKTGVLAFENRFLMWASSAPDYFNRMTLLVAQMLKDGSYDAHVMEKGQLKYDWTKDDRFSVYAAGDKKSEKYNYQRALYLATLDQFNSENITGSGELLQEGDALPRAYTTKQRDSLKSFSDSVHGAMDHEAKTEFDRTFFGMMFIHFKTWLFAKKDKWALEPGVYSRGYFKHKKDPEGNLLYYKIDAEGNKEEVTEITDFPKVEWEGKWQEGILYSIKSMVKEAWDTKMDMEKMGKFVEENPAAWANMKMMLHDFAVMTMLLLIAGLIDFDKMKGDAPYTAAVGRSLLSTGSDLNPISNLMLAINPKSMIPSVGYFTQVATDFTQVLTGDMNAANMLTRDIGALRQFKYMVNTNTESD